ncbi:MAG TPA: TolC family protein [Candidatus Hydrogenedentes bacterium]|nr:TolC family protein [Candidatus Hydrogenedentota bacterium]
MSNFRLAVVWLVSVGTTLAWGESPGAAPRARVDLTSELPVIVDAIPSDSGVRNGEPDLSSAVIDVERIDLGPLLDAVARKDERPRVQLTLDDCVQLALEANPDVVVASYEPLKADGDILSARGEFDPQLTGDVSYLRATQAASPEIQAFSGITSIETYRTSGQTGVAGRLRWGTQYSVSLNMDKEETTYNNFIEEWSGGVTLTVSQPLLRGRGKAVNLTRIRQAENGRGLTESQLRLTVLTAVSEVLKAYWDLVGATETVRVRGESLANAQRLLDINEKRRDIGTAAAIEVIQAKAGVATRISDLIAAQSLVKDAEDFLKQLLDMREEGALAATRIVPVNRPSLEEMRYDEAESVALALEHRPEIVSACLEIENAELERKRAANDLLPQFDVTASVYQGGRGHYPRDVFRGIDDVFDSVGSIAAGVDDRDNFSYSVGFQGSVPLGNRTARGVHQRAKMAVDQTKRRLEKARLDAVARVGFALRALETSRILVLSNRQTRGLQETNVAAEEKRLELGLTTSYRVLEVQEDLTFAQTQEVQALVNYEKAIVDVRLAEGMLLDHLGIAFEAPEPVPAVSFVRSIRTPAAE